MPPIEDPRITRRTMIATAVASALIPVAAIRCAAQNPNQPRALTPAQRKTTEMLVDRIIPADELGPGALECGAANYIDVQLADYLASEKDAWVAGLNALDAFAMERQIYGRSSTPRGHTQCRAPSAIRTMAATSAARDGTSFAMQVRGSRL